MELERAQRVANEVIKRLSPYCKKIEVVGSIRRQKAQVRDIDIVLIPSDPWNLSHEIRGWGSSHIGGDKLMRIMMGNTQVDLYFASSSPFSFISLALSVIFTSLFYFFVHRN